MRTVTRRFALPWFALAAGCGFTDKARELPPDLGPLDGRTISDDSAPDAPPDDGPTDGPTDGATDGATDGVPPAWICDPGYYGDGLDCDCACGVADPDCAGQGCSTVGCCSETTCVAAECLYCGPTGLSQCNALIDECNDAACQVGTCVAVPLAPGSSCDDGLFCTDLDGCNGSGTCVGFGNPCPGHNASPGCDDSCDETSNACTAADGAGTSCDENVDLTLGMCSGALTEPNCLGD